MIYLQKQLNNQSGIALVLSVLILANLLMITLVVTDVIFRIGKSSREISESEVAYFAAETATERAVYEIENNQNASSLGTVDSPSQGSLDYTSGNWQRYIEPVYQILVTCIDNNQQLSHPADPNTETDKSCLYAKDLSQNNLTKANPLKLRLKPGKSFEFNLNISVPSDINFYPSAVTIDWDSVFPGRVIILSADGQQIIDTNTTTGTGKIPSSGQLGSSPDYRIRITNNGTSDVIFTIAPNAASDNLAVGITVTSKGYYDVIDSKERIVAMEKKNWEIY